MWETEQRAELLIDLDAIVHNTRTLVQAAGRPLIAVVKADGYGHGVLPVARAAVAGGASILGVATLAEAVNLVDQRPGAPVLCWLWTPGEDPKPAIERGVQIGISALPQLRRVITSAGGRVVQIHLKADTGLGRGGAVPADWEALCREAAAAPEVSVVGLMSHLATADDGDDAGVLAQLNAFERAVTVAESVGITGATRHLANTPGTLAYPETHLDAVRCGIGIYGLDPLAAGTGLPLRPAMSLVSAVALTKRVPAGHGVSYGWTHRAAAATTLALLPVGYADGLPRAASSRAEVLIGGRRHPVVGRIAMDQCVVDVGDHPVQAGDRVLVFGPGDDGEPTAAEWAAWSDTIHYEIVTRMGGRLPRRHLGGPSEPRREEGHQ